MTIDANIVIAYLAGEEIVVELLSTWKQQGGVLYLPTVSEAEVLSFSQWSRQEYHQAEEFLENNFITIPFDRTIARIAAEIRRFTKMKLPDAAIAATAIFTRTSLLTRNKKDFKHLSGLKVISV